MRNFCIIVGESKSKSKISMDILNALKNALLGHNDVKVNVITGYIDRNMKLSNDTECVITIGGDGTVLRAAKAAYGLDAPFIGINSGHMGYLTEMTVNDDINLLADRLYNDDFDIVERMMLKGEVLRNTVPVWEDIALNEVLLGRRDSVKMVEFEVYVDDILLNTYRADGILIASPTGSTGYSLSAGGPIAEPGAKLIIVTPICPHAINSRSMVLSHKAKISIKAKSYKQLVSCDGAKSFDVEYGDEIVVREAPEPMKFAKFKDVSFLDTLRDKMRSV